MKIPFLEIKEIINEKGSFWKAFDDALRATHIDRKTTIKKIKQKV